MTGENWTPSCQKQPSYICKTCKVKQVNEWIGKNPKQVIKYRRQKHVARSYKEPRPYYENKECSQYLGVHVAERVLSHVFKNVERLPYGHRGYDFICNKGKKIDVKSACLGTNGRWLFAIKRNPVADYFLCLAFGDREDLNPVHVWLIPGETVNHLTGISADEITFRKWDEYRLPIDRVITCCNTMRGEKV